MQKILEKLRKLRKSCNHKWIINGIYNKRLHYNCLQQFPTLRLKTLGKLGNSGEKKCKAQITAWYPVPSLKAKFYSYLIENSQKARLNFFFKSRFSVKPSKFPIYFAHDCRNIFRTVVYWEPCQTSTIEHFAKIFNNYNDFCNISFSLSLFFKYMSNFYSRSSYSM